MTQTSIKTTCPYCGVGCGIEATVKSLDSHQVVIKGDLSHPSNFGKLCSKGATLGDTVSLENRLLYPEIRGRRVDWDSALDYVAQGFNRIIEQYGADAVAFYVSGQLLTEDYYVANKLMKGFIGSANIDTNSRLCMSSAVVGYKRAFGADAVPCNYQDLELAEMIVLIGANSAWCHPIAFQRIRKAKENNPDLKIVVIDPRFTPSCDIADLHLPIKPGMDGFLFNGLLAYLQGSGAIDQVYIDRYTEGFEAALRDTRHDTGDVARVAAACGLDSQSVQQFYDWFAGTQRVVSVYSQGINQSGSGSDKCNAIINCHLATGKIGRPGTGPFSFTGQPNAMGGREVGGLANTLASHLDLENPAHVDCASRFWGSTNVANRQGLKAIELFDAIGTGKIKAVWIMATNPVVTLPDADKVRQALKQCELVVVSECIDATDTVDLAHVKLPACGWSEKDGTVTNLERRISRQRPLFRASGEAKPDWWIISQVATRMGFAKAFAYSSSADIFREHAELSGFENHGNGLRRAFDISAFAAITKTEYDALQPVQWPATRDQPQGTARLFTGAQFFTDNRKARFIPISPRPPHHAVSAEYSLTLNTGRLRDQWHTMTRTSLAPKLNAHRPEPFVEVHPEDAAKLGLQQRSLAEISSRWGRMLARVEISATQQAGSVFVPMHWTAQLSSWGRVGALVNPVVDPHSGQPESKQTPVSIKPWPGTWYAMVLSRNAVHTDDCEYRVKIKGEGFIRHELASALPVPDWRQWSRQLLAESESDGHWQEYRDQQAGFYRAAYLIEDQLKACIFIAPTWRLPDPGWLATLFSKPRLDRAERLALLSGQPPKGQRDIGRIVCSCFNVGEKTILQSIGEHKLQSIAAIGDCLSAGTGCGSCLPELKALLLKSVKETCQ
ncbi:MAG: molybdopterin-dependent oxidoreductase [Methylomonas sp.]